MNESFRSLSKDQILDNLYIQTNKKFPHSDSSDTFFYDFHEFSGIFFYYNEYKRIDLDKECVSHFNLTLDEMLDAVNRNTGDDLFLIPTDRYGVYKLYDKNGDSVERILFNNKRLSAFLRSLDDGYGLYLYPVKRTLWYISIVPMPEDDDIRKDDFIYIKSNAGVDFPYFFKLNSNGTIEEFTQVTEL